MSGRAAAGRFPADLSLDRKVVVRAQEVRVERPSVDRRDLVVRGASQTVFLRGQAALDVNHSVVRLAPRRLAVRRLIGVQVRTLQKGRAPPGSRCTRGFVRAPARRALTLEESKRGCRNLDSVVFFEKRFEGEDFAGGDARVEHFGQLAAQHPFAVASCLSRLRQRQRPYFPA